MKPSSTARPYAGTTVKKANQFFNDDDLNDRIELDRSIKVIPDNVSNKAKVSKPSS